MHQDCEFRIVQGGVTVAQVVSPELGSAVREIARYASQYVQDGPVLIQMRANKSWKTLSLEDKLKLGL